MLGPSLMPGGSMATIRQINRKYSGKQALKAAIKKRKEAKKIAQRIYKDKIKELRPYLKRLRKIDLRHNISPQRKSYINAAWEEYQNLTVRPTKIYRTRNKANLKMAQEFGRHENGKIKFDVAFIPTADPKAKIKIKNGQIQVISKNVIETNLYFNQKNLAADPEKEIAATLARNKEAKAFKIMAAEHDYNGGLARSLVSNEVQKLMMKYGDSTANNYYPNWLWGVKASTFKNQKDYEDYARAYGKKLKENKTAKRNERRSRGRKYGEKF